MATYVWIIALLAISGVLLTCWLLINRFIGTSRLDSSSVELVNARTDVVKTFLQACGLVAIVVAAFNAWSGAKATQKQLVAVQEQVELSGKQLVSIQKQVKLSEIRLETERFATAVDQLGSGSEQTRIGGIFALEQLALSNPLEYHQSVFEVIPSFVRLNACSTSFDEIPSLEDCPRLAVDIQAALSVIGRRNVEWELENAKGFMINLRFADLRRADLANADLRFAVLEGADLRFADLSGADLRSASISDADLSHADMRYVQLEDAYLVSSNLHDVYLVDADAQNSNMSNVNLTDSHLEDIDLSGALLFCADLRYTDLNNACLVDAALVSAILYDTDLSYVSEGMKISVFRGAYINENMKPPIYLADEWEQNIEELLLHDEWPSYWPRYRISVGCKVPEFHGKRYWPGF